MTYKDKLKHPKWQKTRLQVLERDSFKCCACGDKDNMLHVHHKYYEKGKDPWDYDLSCFLTLCEKCHKLGHTKIRVIFDKAIIHPSVIIKELPELSFYFQAISNHKGRWNLYLNSETVECFLSDHVSKKINDLVNKIQSIATCDHEYYIMAPIYFDDDDPVLGKWDWHKRAIMWDF